MVLLVAMPSLIVPGVAEDTSQMVVATAFVAAIMVFIEYNGSSTSILEFRFAPPYNRLKFGFIAATVLFLSLTARSPIEAAPISDLAAGLGRVIGNALDFPYSPVRSMTNLMPVGADAKSIDAVRSAAGVSYAAAMMMALTFLMMVLFFGWPVRNGAFNVCLNLPLFDPTGGGDVVDRLQRDAGLNVSLGFVLPFLIPVGLVLITNFAEKVGYLLPLNLIWITCAWAFLPASLIMRGVAMFRIAGLISQKRQRAYAKAEAEPELQIA
ncbi:hypothetical protein [Roseovarius nubinhibens]|nr:hypothetical protein [Roseovarius nubinhibens]